jgi:hypothetical protein
VLIAFAAVAIPLLAAGSAHAAMAGANPATTTLRPDLRSAAITSVNTTNGTTVIQVCFDKQIGSTPAASGFRVGNYGEQTTVADAAARDANGTCANVTYSSTFIDPQERTFMFVANGAVVNAANGIANLQDSTALVGSNSHSGTRGHTIAPDLEGVVINQGLSQVTYTMDQFVGGVSPAPNCFFANLQNGGQANSGAAANATFSGNTIVVQFPTGSLGAPGNPVTQAGVRNNCVFSTTGVSNPTNQSVAAPGTGGLTTHPDLIAVTVDSGKPPAQTFAHFTFDSAVTFTGGHPASGDFFLGRSDGTTICSAQSAGATINPGSNTVDVPLAGCLANLQDEYIVWGDVTNGVVQTGGSANLDQGVPAGGNSGAFANGFTTGPDAFSTAFSTSTNTVNVVLDQRWFASTVANMRLLDDTGTELPATATSAAIIGSNQTPGTVLTTISFTGDISGARTLLLGTPSFVTATGAPNVPQQLSPATATKHLKRKHGHVKWHKVSRHQLVKRFGHHALKVSHHRA